MVLLDMALNINPEVSVFYADTDFLLPETYVFKNAVAKR
jgi:3'-phosphoadenosine 5'-phosphosulfate sulfotransferase (PAPS reductase)/FAD synthetase